MRKLNKNIYNYIEYELFNYNSSKENLEILKLDSIYASADIDINSGIRSKYKKSNRVESSVISILSNKQISRLSSTIGAINNALKMLDKVHYDFFRSYYIMRYGKLKICDQLGLSERSFYNYKNRIVWAVATEMGWMDKWKQ